MKRRVGIAGGGAAGLGAASYAARSGAEVTIIEKNDCLGKKLSMTGNGRCNLTNLDLKSEYYNPSARRRMDGWIERYGAVDAIDFFRSLGVITRSEDGYIYPVSGQAQTVVNALKNELKRLGVTVIYKEQVKSIRREGDCYIIKTSESETEVDSCIISTGSLSGVKSTLSTGDGYYICSQLGMNIKDTYPALVGFKCAQDEIMPAQGVRCDCRVTFYLGKEVIATERGEVQLTKDTVSGIPVMQASRDIIQYVKNEGAVTAELDFFPDYGDKEFADLKEDMMALSDERSLSEFLLGFSNSNINEMILGRMKLSGDMKMKNIHRSMINCILDNYRALKIKLLSDSGYAASQVTKGGVSLGDITDDMSYKNDPGIFVTGELLDVDGRCGGYNLQWAWCSGKLAGVAAAGQK